MSQGKDALIGRAGWRQMGELMNKGLRIALVIAAVIADVVFTLGNSSIQDEEWIINIDFWGLVALPVIVVLGLVFIRKADAT